MEPGKHFDNSNDFDFLINDLSKILSQICFNNYKRVDHDLLKEELFVGDSVPDMSLKDYLDRCAKYFRCSPSCLIVSIIYIDRMIDTYQDQKLFLHSFNVHRLFVTALTLACKHLEDKVYTNKYYAQVGGLSLQEMNRFEYRILQKLDYNLNVPLEVFQEYSKQFIPPSQKDTIKKRRRRRRRHES